MMPSPFHSAPAARTGGDGPISDQPEGKKHASAGHSQRVHDPLEAPKTAMPLYPGASATVWADRVADSVVLTIVDERRGTFTLAIPSNAASDLAVALVNAANGV